MTKMKYTILVILILSLGSIFSCAAQRAEHRVHKTGADKIDIYVGEKPTRPYKKINFVTFSHPQPAYAYDKFLLKAKELGADGIILISTPQYTIKENGAIEMVQVPTPSWAAPQAYSGIAIKYTDETEKK